MPLATWGEPASVRSVVTGLAIFGVWLGVGMSVHIGLRGRTSLAYWLYMAFMLPLVIGGGAFAALAAVKWGSPPWPVGVTLFCGVALHAAAGLVLAQPSNRPVVERMRSVSR